MRVLLLCLMASATTVAAASQLDLLPLGPVELAYHRSTAPSGSLYDARAGVVIDLAELTARLAEADIVVLGEEHTAMDQKLVQAQLIDGIAATGRRVVVALEFFQRGDNHALDRWVAGELDDRGLLEVTGWYDRSSYRWQYTRPVMQVARARGLAVVGANVPRDIPRTVNRQGLEGLSDDQRAEVGEIAVEGSPQHRYLVARYFGDTAAMLPPSWFANMYAAQCLWDVVMARSTLDVVADDTTVVLVAGSGHVAYGLGIPRRVADERAAAGLPALSIVTICPVSAPAPDPDGTPSGHPMTGGHHGRAGDPPAIFARSLADYVAVFADRGGIDAYPTLGLRLTEDEDHRPMVSATWPDTIAEAVGFAPGDRVLDVNGRQPADLSDLRFLLAELDWDDRAGLLVERGGTEIEIAALLFPEVNTSETTPAPGYAVDELVAFAPDASVAVPDLVVPADRARWRLVRRDDIPVRVELHRGEILDEVHELGDDGRVVRSLYRVARDDGAVEIRYRRNDDGQVVDSQVFDRAGTVIGGS